MASIAGGDVSWWSRVDMRPSSPLLSTPYQPQFQQPRAGWLTSLPGSRTRSVTHESWFSSSQCKDGWNRLTLQLRMYWVLSCNVLNVLYIHNYAYANIHIYIYIVIIHIHIYICIFVYLYIFSDGQTPVRLFLLIIECIHAQDTCIGYMSVCVCLLRST